MDNVEEVAEKSSEEVKVAVSDVAIEKNVAEEPDNLKAEEPLASVVGIIHRDEENIAVAKLKIYNLVTKEYDIEKWSLIDLTTRAFSRSLVTKGYLKKEAKILVEVTQKGVRSILDANDRGLITKSHSILGWFKTQNQLVFKADAIYSGSGIIESVYAGKYSIVSQGDFQIFKKMIETCVVGQTPLEGVCSMGIAATFLPYLNAIWGTNIDNPLNHMVGTTSKGKSSAAALFVSLGSAPFGEGSLMLSFLSTANALLAQVSGISGYPTAIDELSAASGTELTFLVYGLADGIGKRRCLAGGTALNADSRFCTVFLL